MRKLIVLIGVLLGTATAASATEGGPSHGHIGVGVSHTLAGFNTGEFVYDAGKFHIEALLGFASQPQNAGQNDITLFGLGGRFWYSVHQTTSSDFNVGAGMLIESRSAGRSNTDVDLEIGGQIRAFLVPNVAFTAELGVVFANNDDVGIAQGLFGGNMSNNGYVALGATAGLGLQYFF